MGSVKKANTELLGFRRDLRMPKIIEGTFTDIKVKKYSNLEKGVTTQAPVRFNPSLPQDTTKLSKLKNRGFSKLQ